MVASISGGSGGVADWANSVFSKLDTKKQGYIEKTDLASALSASGESEGASDSGAVDDMFSAIDGDSDGKVTKSELSEAMTRLSDQLNAQFDASRVQGGMPPGAAPGGQAPGADGAQDAGASVDAAGASAATGAAAGAQGAGGPRGAGGAHGGGGAGKAESTDETDSTDSSTSTDYVAAADTDGDGTVSDAEQAAYDKKVASGEIDKNGNPTARAEDGGGTEKTRRKDPERELAQALHMLKAYADNDGGDTSAASTGSTSSVSVEA